MLRSWEKYRAAFLKSARSSDILVDVLGLEGSTNVAHDRLVTGIKDRECKKSPQLFLITINLQSMGRHVAKIVHESGAAPVGSGIARWVSVGVNVGRESIL